MLTICSSTKGGSGTSTVTAGLAGLLVLQPSQPLSPLVIDLAGDLPAIFGVGYPTNGLAEWLTRSFDGELGDLFIDCAGSTRLLATGSLTLPESTSSLWNRLSAFVNEEVSSGHHVFIDAGCQAIPEALLLRTAPHTRRTLLVLRPCYLALRRAMHEATQADGIVLITGGGRVLTRHDVESVLGIPVVAEVPLDPDIARRVDSGLFHSRLPRTLVASLSPVVATL
jgi:hypothetical protein